MAYVAGSDVHGGFEIGYAQTIFDFPMHESSDEKIKEAILKKQLSVAGCEVSLRREVVSHFSRIFKTLRRK